MKTRTWLLLFCVAVGSIACAVRTDGIPDDQIGLSKVDVFDVPEPDPFLDNTLDPGDGTPAVRAYEGAPPVISHGIADFLPITREDNLCIDCHQVDDPAEGDPTAIPASHFTDFRNAPGDIRPNVAGARYNCVACHAVMTQAEPLVPRPAASN